MHSMKNIKILVLLSLGAMLNACTGGNTTTIDKLDNGYYSIIHKNLSFTINPALGARVISAKVEDKELLLQERGELLNWGSTFWPSPQSNWNWPPPHAFQFGAYIPEITNDRLILKSEVDPKMGMQTVKTFTFNEKKNCLEIEYQILNDTDSILRVGPWEIVCVPAIGSKVFFPMGTSPKDISSSLEFTKTDGIGWFDFDKENLESNHKLFNNSLEGWLAHINGQRVLFIKTFELVPAEDLPPGQGNVEVYVSKQMEYIELENHGKFTELAPHESLQYTTQWYISDLPESIADTVFSYALIEQVLSIIQ